MKQGFFSSFLIAFLQETHLLYNIQPPFPLNFSSFCLFKIPQLSVWKLLTSLTTCYLLSPNH